MKTDEITTQERRLVGLRDFMAYTGVGKNTAQKLGHEIGCRVRIGSRVLYDLRKADEYFDKHSEH